MAFSIVAFSFVCHDSAFLIYQTLENNTQPRWARVAHYSMGGALLVCLMLAVPGESTDLFVAGIVMSGPPRVVSAINIPQCGQCNQYPTVWSVQLTSPRVVSAINIPQCGQCN
jgi:amino acid permease